MSWNSWKDWGIIALIVGILGILWSMGFLKYEGFALEETGFTRDDQIAREDGRFGKHFKERTDYYHKATSDSAIYANSGIVNSIQDFGKKLTSAFEQIGFPEKDYGAYVRPIVPDTLQGDFNACAALKTIDAWIASTTTSCGWMLLEDDTTGPKPSMAILGTEEGPHPRIKFPTGFPAYKWYWITQKAEAKQAEEEKECKRITVCGGIDVTKNCAFNTRDGKGIYYNRSVVNPENPDIVTTPGNCPKNQTFCDGVILTEGKAGCIKQILSFEGIPTKAWVYKNVGTNPSADYVKVRNTVYERAKTTTDLMLLDTDLTGAGVVNLATIQPMRKKLQYLKRLTTSYDRFLADLAQMLVYGELLDGREFILENYYYTAATTGVVVGNDDHKVLAVDILQKEWRKAGCQPAGREYPTDIVKNKSLSDVQREYRVLRQQAQTSESPLIQQEAIEKCLNAGVKIDTTAEQGDFCNERGIEYFLYDGDGDLAILIGHLYSMNGLLIDPLSKSTVAKAAAMRNVLNSSTVYPTISYKARTMISTPNKITMTPYPSSSWSNKSAYTIMVNKDIVSTASQVEFPAERRNIFEVSYSGLKTTTWGQPKYSFIDLNLDMFQLFQSALKPFISFNFYEGTYLDSNRVVELDTVAGLQFGASVAIPPQNTGIKIGTTGTRVKLNRRIRSNLIKMISQRVKLSSDSSRITLFVLENTASYTETCEVRGNTIVYTVRNGYDAPQTYVWNISDSVPVYDTWVNIAVEYKRDPANNTQEYEVYVNQKSIDMAAYSSKNFRITNETFMRPMDVYVMNPEFAGEMSWFHIYDITNTGVRSIEGFQNPGSVLDQEASFDPQKQTGATLKRRDANIGNFLIDQVKQSSLFNYSSSSSSAPPVASVAQSSAADTSTGASASTSTTTGPSATCPFDPVKAEMGINANYNSGVYYGERFDEKNTTSERTMNVKSARECEDVCTRKQCQAFTFNSAAYTCDTYTDLGANLQTIEDRPSISTILKEKKDMGYEELKKQTLKAIEEFKNIRSYLKKKQIYDQVFKERTGFGLYDRTMSLAPTMAPGAATQVSLSDLENIVQLDDPRTETEINRDEKNVTNNMYTKDCLNGIYQKYRI
jgi:hypothetical protein